jgi:ribosome-associated translation inhibitor RaiA
MDINIHSPHQAVNEDQLRQEVADTLRHFADRLTRVDVYVKDQNAAKGGIDMRCSIEARPRGLDPVAAEELAETASEAVLGAARKLQRQLESAFGKRADHHRG